MSSTTRGPGKEIGRDLSDMSYFFIEGWVFYVETLLGNSLHSTLYPSTPAVTHKQIRTVLITHTAHTSILADIHRGVILTILVALQNA
jgi:hypothetical protein